MTEVLCMVKGSRIHHKGVFAKRDIKKGEHIIEYIGKKISKEESEKIYQNAKKKAKWNKELGVVYIFDLNNKFDLDGNFPNNDAKYVNHSCSPNAEAVQEDDRIWIIATKPIAKGEEITYNYGYTEEYLDHPCHCGAKNCVGYILDESLWPKLKKELKKK